MLFTTMLYQGHGFEKSSVAYDVRDVLDLQHMLHQHGGHELQVVTDGAFDIPCDIHQILMPVAICFLPNYLPKLWLWSSEFHDRIEDQLAFLDLDCVVLKDPAPLVKMAKDDDLRIWDWAKDERYNTSFFVLRKGCHNKVWWRRSEIEGAMRDASRWTGDQSFVGYVLGPDQPVYTLEDGVTPFRKQHYAPPRISKQHRVEKHRKVCAGAGEEPLIVPGLDFTPAPDATLVFFCGTHKPRTYADRVFWVRNALDKRDPSEKTDRERLAHLGKPCSQHKVLIKAIQENGWTRGAEIGVLRGKTFFAMLDACPDLTLYGVDQWKQLPFREDENAETYQAFDMEGFYQTVVTRCRDYPLRAHACRGDSVDMAATFREDTFDFVFIDGDHTEAGFERDLRAWAPKVQPGGVVFGHDYSWPTVQRVLNKLAPKWQRHDHEVWSIPREGVMV